MLKYLSLFLVLLFLIPSVAYAGEFERALVRHKGAMGYWFSEEIGNMLLDDIEELQYAQERIVLFEEKLELKDETIALLRLDLEITVEISNKWKEAYEESDKLVIRERDRYEELRDSKDKWYKHPMLWTTVGFIIGAASTVGIGYSLYGTK